LAGTVDRALPALVGWKRSRTRVLHGWRSVVESIEAENVRVRHPIAAAAPVRAPGR